MMRFDGIRKLFKNWQRDASWKEARLSEKTDALKTNMNKDQSRLNLIYWRIGEHFFTYHDTHEWGNLDILAFESGATPNILMLDEKLEKESRAASSELERFSRKYISLEMLEDEATEARQKISVINKKYAHMRNRQRSFLHELEESDEKKAILTYINNDDHNKGVSPREYLVSYEFAETMPVLSSFMLEKSPMRHVTRMLMDKPYRYINSIHTRYQKRTGKHCASQFSKYCLFETKEIPALEKEYDFYMQIATPIEETIKKWKEYHKERWDKKGKASILASRFRQMMNNPSFNKAFLSNYPEYIEEELTKLDKRIADQYYEYDNTNTDYKKAVNDYRRLTAINTFLFDITESDPLAHRVMYHLSLLNKFNTPSEVPREACPIFIEALEQVMDQVKSKHHVSPVNNLPRLSL